MYVRYKSIHYLETLYPPYNLVCSNVGLNPPCKIQTPCGSIVKKPSTPTAWLKVIAYVETIYHNAHSNALNFVLIPLCSSLWRGVGCWIYFTSVLEMMEILGCTINWMCSEYWWVSLKAASALRMIAWVISCLSGTGYIWYDGSVLSCHGWDLEQKQNSL